jgi:hypothetical protein
VELSSERIRFACQIKPAGAGRETTQVVSAERPGFDKLGGGERFARRDHLVERMATYNKIYTSSLWIAPLPARKMG